MSNAQPGRIAFVTGASSGVGAASATRLQDEGYAVYGTSRKVDAGRSRTSGIALRVLDVRNDNAVAGLIDEVMREAERIDVLVNNAGSMLAREDCNSFWLECNGELVDSCSVKVLRLRKSPLGIQMLEFVCPRRKQRHESLQVR